MTPLNIATILLFAATVVAMGLSFSGRGKNMKSFFAAGGAVPWQTSGLSLFMGFFSAGTFVVWGSIAYSLGWVSVVIQWTMAVAGFAVGFLLAPRWHRTGALTAAEYITQRLSLRTQKVFTYLFLFVSLFTTGAFLYPVAKIAEVSTGLPLDACILLLGGFCVLYVSVGGLWAVMSTDVLQFIILTAAVLIVIPLSFGRADGVLQFIQSAPDTFFNPVNGEYSVGFIIAFGIYNAVFLGGNWAYIQRYTSVKTTKDSRRVGWLFGALYLVSPILWMLPPMIYRTVDPTLSGLEAEGAYLLMCKEVLPDGLLGLMLGGMIFATASSLNATLNISSGVITNDIFKRLRPDSSDSALMRMARISTIGVGIAAIVVALLIPAMGGIVNTVISVSALTGVPLYLPVIWTLFSRRQTSFSVLTTTLVGLGVNCLFKFLTPALCEYSLSRGEEMILGVTLPVVLLVFFEIYYAAKGRHADGMARYDTWQAGNARRKAETPAAELDAQRDDNRFSLRMIGYGILFTGIVIILLSIPAAGGRGLVAGMGLLLVLIGTAIYAKSRRK